MHVYIRVALLLYMQNLHRMHVEKYHISYELNAWIKKILFSLSGVNAQKNFKKLIFLAKDLRLRY